MKKIFIYIQSFFVKLLLEALYKITHKVELKDLELNGNPVPDSYSFYREAFNLYQTDKSCQSIDDIIENSKIASKNKEDKFRKHQLQYSYYPDINNKKH